MRDQNEVVRSTIQKRDDKGVIRHGGEWLALWSDPDSMKTADELRAEAHEAGLVAAIERNLAAAARSLSGDPQLRIVFGDDGEGPMRLPKLAPSDCEAARLSAIRGEADSQALLIRHHDAGIFRRQAHTAGNQIG